MAIYLHNILEQSSIKQMGREKEEKKNTERAKILKNIHIIPQYTKRKIFDKA